MGKVVVTPRPFHQKGQRWVDQLRSHGHEVVVNDLGRRFTNDELRGLITDAQAIITGNDALDADTLSCAPDLKVVAKYGVGVDNIDVAWCEAHGVAVCKALGANSTSVAEDAIMLMLVALRRFYELARLAKSGEDCRVMGHEADGKVLGLVGVGSIGSRVARFARALDMRVLGYDPALAPDTAPEGVELVADRSDLLAASDVVSLHLPLLPSTRGSIDAAFLAQMKHGAVLVNTARGGLVDPDALYDALVSGQLSFAAEDVELKERPEKLVALDSYVVTPHAASFTAEADEKTMSACVDNVIGVIG